jgi:cardiolipin synthase
MVIIKLIKIKMLKVYTSNTEAFDQYCKEIESAQESIIIFTWIIVENNHIFEKISSILKNKVKEGVNVHLVYSDAILSAYISSLLEGRKLDIKSIKDLKESGIHIHPYTSLKRHLKSKLYSTAHSKITLVDKRVAIIGDRNLSDEYYTDNKNIITTESLDLHINDVDFCSQFYTLLMNFINTENVQCILNLNQKEENMLKAFLFSDPRYSEINSISNLYKNLFQKAKKEIIIVNYNFSPDLEMVEILLTCLENKIPVTIITDGSNSFDGNFMSAVTKHVCKKLNTAGAKIYFYKQENKYLHMKYAIIDNYVVVGSYNFAMLSYQNSLENVVLVKDPEVSNKLKKQIKHLQNYTFNWKDHHSYNAFTSYLL